MDGIRVQRDDRAFRRFEAVASMRARIGKRSRRRVRRAGMTFQHIFDPEPFDKYDGRHG
jgi:hypothetical protein